jgi:hypothetical protein
MYFQPIPAFTPLLERHRRHQFNLDVLQNFGADYVSHSAAFQTDREESSPPPAAWISVFIEISSHFNDHNEGQ